MAKEGSVSLEKMHHFRCVDCDRWWSIADIPSEPSARNWFCPWCGSEQGVVDKTPKRLD